ncbi:MAG: hypothetical protein SFW36_00175 [Leptolyngbyaceae cyanobacterium bins.59]|nr:hypothetical protein [Leptolyngbyaceae cyanobacterium bins.59]
MEFWEFLLQKEGDRSWLPLESPDVEILEGRYRVVARTSRSNTAVEIRITHTATDEVPPKRRIQTRSHQTNKDGLMIIFPFTRLKPGLWELRCSADVMSSLMGESWQHAVRLQVASEQAEDALDWEPDWQAGEAEDLEEPKTTEIAEESRAGEEVPTPETVPGIVSDARPDRVAEESINLAQATVPPIAPDPAPVPSPSIPASPASPASDLIPAPSANESTAPPEKQTPEVAFDPNLFGGPVLTIALDREAWMAQWGESFLLTGQIQIPDEVQDPLQLPVELQIYLRDPQSLQVLVEVCQPLALHPASTLFACLIAIPANCRPRLLLGEVCLYRVEEDAGASLTPLASQSFTVTAAIGELLNTLNRISQGGPEALLTEETEESAPETPPEPVRPSLDLTSLKLIDTPKAQHAFRPAAKQALPPRIISASPEKPVHRSIELPNLRKSQPQPIAPSAEETPGENPIAGDLEFSAVPPASPPEEASVLLPEEAVESGNSPAQLTLQETPVEPPKPSTFGSFQRQSRFFDRLAALATDDELAALLKAELPQPLVLDAQGELMTADSKGLEERNGEITSPSAGAFESTPQQEAEIPQELAPLPVDPEEQWIMHEIVVEDDPNDRNPSVPEPPVATTVVLDDAEPVPVPELEVPSGELVAGQVIHIRIRLPMTPYRLFVKFWMTDRQTFSLIEDPRTLMTLTPNGLGALESTLVLTVPYGSLEISLEAIAVELHSMRESHKVSAHRLVVPPDLPLLSLEDLEA